MGREEAEEREDPREEREDLEEWEDPLLDLLDRPDLDLRLLELEGMRTWASAGCGGSGSDPEPAAT